MPSTLDTVREFINTRHDEIETIRCGFKATPRVHSIIESLNSRKDNVKDILLVEDVQLPFNKIKLIGYDKKDLKDFDL